MKQYGYQLWKSIFFSIEPNFLRERRRFSLSFFTLCRKSNLSYFNSEVISQEDIDSFSFEVKFRVVYKRKYRALSRQQCDFKIPRLCMEFCNASQWVKNRKNSPIVLLVLYFIA